MNNYKHFFYFDFTQGLTADSLIKCPDCKEWISVWRWIHTEGHCEVCGDHPGLLCPLCHNFLDHIWDDETLEVKNEQSKKKNR